MNLNCDCFLRAPFIRDVGWKRIDTVFRPRIDSQVSRLPGALLRGGGRSFHWSLMMKRFARTAFSLGVLLFSPGMGIDSSQAAGESPVRSPAEIRAAVDALHVEEVPWRDVAWRTCLVDGLNESRAANKPVILWIFIDRPVNDERC